MLAIVLHDLKVFLADRSNLPGLLLTPMVMTVIVGVVNGGGFGGEAPPTRLDVIDRDQGAEAGQLLDAVAAAGAGLILCPMDNTPDDPCALGEAGGPTEPQALERLANGTTVALLEIPAGFSQALASQSPTSVILRSTGDFGPAQAAEQAVRAALRQINGAAVASRVGLAVVRIIEGSAPAGQGAADLRSGIYQRALAEWQTQPLRVELALSGSEERLSLAGSLQQGLGQSVPGMGTMFVMMTVFGGMSALIEERRQWTLQRLAVLPISRPTLIGGKIFARFSLGVLQFLVIFVVGAVLKMDFGVDPLAIALLAVVYTLAVTALSFAIGGRLKNPAQANGVGLLLTLTLAPLGGAWWPIEVAPRFMQIAGHVSPVAWAMDGFTALTYEGAHLADVWGPLVVLLGLALAAFLIAIPRFRYQAE
jgi:ABC-type multidrug transport system permease subunit